MYIVAAYLVPDKGIKAYYSLVEGKHFTCGLNAVTLCYSVTIKLSSSFTIVREIKCVNFALSAIRNSWYLFSAIIKSA